MIAGRERAAGHLSRALFGDRAAEAKMAFAHE